MDSVQVYMFEMNRIRQTDPNGFALMIAGVSLMVFLSLTILGGFIFFLYKGTGTYPDMSDRPVQAPPAAPPDLGDQSDRAPDEIPEPQLDKTTGDTTPETDISDR